MKHILFLMIPLLLGACKSSQPSASIENAVQAKASSNVEMLASGSTCGIAEKMELLISDEATWKALWDKIYAYSKPVPALPEVDWDNYRLVAAFMGQKSSGGYAISVENVQVTDSFAALTVVHNEPGATCFVTMGLSQPFVIAKIKGKFDEIRPNIKNLTQNCN